MANKVQLKAAGDPDFKDNDPFAELTRIMGFDPRVQPTPRPDEDFEIDLEKELMGMFDPGPDAPAGPSSASDYPQEIAAGSPAADDMDEALAANLEEELSGSEDFWQPMREQDAAAAPQGEEAYSAPVGEGMADVDMDFGVSQQRDAPERLVEMEDAATAGEDEAAEPSDAAPSEGLNVYRPVFFAPGYTSHDTTEAKPAPRQYGAVEAPVFDIRSFKSAAQQYREAAPRHAAPVTGEERGEAPVEEKPAPRGRDPFDILAALGTERGLPQRRDPLKSAPAPEPVEATAPAEPAADHPAQEAAQENWSSAEAFFEEKIWQTDIADREGTPDTAEPLESASGPGEAETASFVDAEPAAASEAGERGYAAADIDRLADAVDASGDPAAAEGETPEIETTEVFEPAVAVADDLDIPVPAFQTEARIAPVYDELDEEFEHTFQTLSQHTEAVRQAAVPAEASRPASTTMDIERLFAEELGIGGSAVAAENPAVPEGAAEGFTAAGQKGATVEDEFVFDDTDFLPDEFQTAATEEEDDRFFPEGAAVYAPRRLSRTRGRLLAGVVIGVAVLGGIGAFALTRGGSGKSDQPVVLKADSHPVKVKPKNPGGVSVPNQDNKVYERVEDGAKAVAPEQKKLVSTEEQPVDISARSDNSGTALPGVFEDDQIGTAKAGPSAGGKADAGAQSAPAAGKAAAPSQDIADLIKAAPSEPAAMAKGEDRLAPTPDNSPRRADNDVLAVTPHKVKTMIVRADGTMVPREDPAPAAEAKPAAPAQAANQNPSTVLPSAAPVPTQEPPARTVAAKPAASTDDAMAAMAKAEVKPAEASRPVPAKPAERLDRGEINTPAKVAVAPSRPAEQPLDIVGKTPQKVASAEPAPAAAPVAEAAGDWSVQIASQPTAEAAQTSYQNMARRYANVLGGHAANIVKAEIAGKGTYYRVRIATGSKEDAIALCTKLKAAGGSCFVSK